MSPTLDDLSRASPERPLRLGRYDVTGIIRAGGMGAVYDALDRDHGTRVALKTLTDLDAESLLRFKNEFRAVADLSHPNLVPLYELGRIGDLWFFTMERIDGVDFVEHIRGTSPGDARTDEEQSAGSDDPTRRRGAVQVQRGGEAPASLPTSLPVLRDALAQLVCGVRALHEHDLLHLDLKPSNVLVDGSGRVAVLDFGLVRRIRGGPVRLAPADDENVLISGTPAWMAPEQFSGGEVSEAADWYAVGLMLYRALTGVPAFAPGTAVMTWFAKLHVRPAPPDQLLAAAPADLSALAMALLDPEPSRRPRGETLVSLTSGDPLRRAEAETQLVRSDLVGRARERALLGDALSRMRSGGSAVVHLEGPSGVGKSTLLRALRDDARAGGDALVLRGRCYERETVPYKAFDAMIDELAARMSASESADVETVLPEWTAELARVFPVLTRVPAVVAHGATGTMPAVELRRRAGEALRALFAHLAERRPLILEIDDLQWADADSAALLAKLVEAPMPGGLLIAASFRREASASPALAPYLDAVRGLGRRDDVRLVAIEVGPLPPKEAEALAQTTLAALDVRAEGLAAGIAAEAAGVPFFVEELARHVAEERASGREPSIAGISLSSLLARRVQGLPPAERSLVEVLAVANSPIPLSVSFGAAGIEQGGLRALWSLRSGQFVRSTGAAADDRTELQHDRMRESVLSYLAPDRIEDLELALGRALAERVARGEGSAWLFDAVRHLAAAEHRLEGAERRSAARLHLEAGRRARRVAAFPLAFDSFDAGTRLLDARAWDEDYELALALHGGAAESAYLSSSFGALDAHVSIVEAHGRSVIDQLVAWEAKIDAHIARSEYDAAVAVALEVLRRLDVDLPPHPGADEVGAEVGRAMAALAGVGTEGFATLPLLDDEQAAAAMRIQSRISSAAYFARPMLLPVLACRQVAMSVERGLSPVTPYALAVYGIVLNSIGMLREAHAWGGVALELLDRFEGDAPEARTRHIVHDLVCTFVVPLASTLDDLRRVVEIGKKTGDLEYAGYAAHAWVHNALYAGRELGRLFSDALALGAFLRSHGQINALHVHAPFEQVLRCFTGRARDPARLDGDGFEEEAALEAARSAGSRSAQHIVRLLMGMVRFHFGSREEACAVLEEARPFLDGVASTWHVPIFHQYAALAIAALPEAERAARAGALEASLLALRALAEQGPENFAHRVALVEAAVALAEGRTEAATGKLRAVIAAAEAGCWSCDLVLAHDLAASAHAAAGDEPARAAHARAGDEAWSRWGARAARTR